MNIDNLQEVLNTTKSGSPKSFYGGIGLTSIISASVIINVVEKKDYVFLLIFIFLILFTYIFGIAYMIKHKNSFLSIRVAVLLMFFLVLIMFDAALFYIALKTDSYLYYDFSLIILFQFLDVPVIYFYNKYMISQNLRKNFSRIKLRYDFVEIVLVFLVGIIPMLLCKTTSYDWRVYVLYSLLSGMLLIALSIFTTEIYSIKRIYKKNMQHSFKCK